VPKVSVVIPVYNQAQFIAEAIQSVLTQSFRDFEIIVIDDGSTDNTPEIASAFPVRYFRQANQGVAAARNRGIALSLGKYIAFLDSDDIMLENALEKGVAVLDKYLGVSFSYGQAFMMNENGGVYRVRKSSFLKASAIVNGKDEIRDLLFPYRITTSTVMVRRCCLDEVGGFHEKLRSEEDRHLFIRLAMRWPAAYIAEPLIKYRVRPGSLSREVSPEIAERAYLLILGEVFGNSDSIKPWKSRVYCYCYRRIADVSYGKDMRQARHYWRRALRVYPQVLLQWDGLSIAYRYIVSLLPSRLWLALRNVKRFFSNSLRD
jgi:glycosyltransferase involved in cell wall biosynthesis